MRSRILPALALLAAAVAGVVAYAQTQPPRAEPVRVYESAQPAPVVLTKQPVYESSRASPVAQTSPAPTSSPQLVAPSVPVGDTPLDTLVAELKGMQAQKAALAKREAEVVAEVRRRLEDYTGTLEKLGHGATRPSGPATSELPTGPRIVRPAGGGRGTPDESTPRSRNEYVPYTEPAPGTATPSELTTSPPAGRRRSPVPLTEPAPAVPFTPPAPPPSGD